MTGAIWSRANLVNLMTAVSKSYLDLTEQELFGRIADTMIQHISAPAQRPAVNAAELTERLIQAAVDYEAGRIGGPAMSAARRAVENALAGQGRQA